MSDLTPVEGCKGCESTAGRLGCPTHSPNVYVSDIPKPYTQLYLRCPECGQDIQLDCFKLESLGIKKIT